jgi:hypothetical protein
LRQAELAHVLSYRAAGGAFDVSRYQAAEEEEAEPPQRQLTVLVLANQLVASNKKLQTGASNYQLPPDHHATITHCGLPPVTG